MVGPMGAQVHYELFIRKTPAASWTLELATEDRARALSVAEEALTDKRAASVKVTKESLDEETREFRSVTILTKGAPEATKAKPAKEDNEPLCVSPQDLYTSHARDRIGQLLEPWLVRQKITAFELMHRADMAELLDASGVEIQHAIQKVAIPEAQARAEKTHDIIRHFQALVERTIGRLTKDERRGALPDFSKQPFAETCERLKGDPDRAYLLGAGVARALAPSKDWTDKLGRLLDLADAAPQGPARAMALSVLEQPLTEMLASKSALNDLLGADLELGPALTAMTRLGGAEAVDALLVFDPSLASALPALAGPAARLANWLDGPNFPAVRTAISKRVLKELHGPRRLRPGDPEAEIKSLRILAMALTATAGRVLNLDDIQAAFAERSKSLTANDFVDSLTSGCGSARLEAEALIRLAENVTGGVAKRQAARWLASTFGTLKFEKEFRNAAEPPMARLAGLAALQRGILRAHLPAEDCQPLVLLLGEIGGLSEADTKFTAAIARANAPLMTRIDILARMAIGETAPLGPAADRAKIEALKLARTPEAKPLLEAAPETLALLRLLVAPPAAAAAAAAA